MDENDIKANIEEVTKHSNALINMVHEYFLSEGVQLIDAFMIVHNVHKQIVDGVAKAWAPGVPEDRTYRMADMTFRSAMREKRREIPPKNGFTPPEPPEALEP